jgi:hypothetical protein
MGNGREKAQNLQGELFIVFSAFGASLAPLQVEEFGELMTDLRQFGLA